jgi:MoaA/NifB/PqqE/SkfB family radical SAM enzyme
MNQFPNVLPVSFIPTALGIWGWHFPEDRMGETVVIDGKKIKKLLTLDINIPDDNFASIINDSPLGDVTHAFRKHYPCPHACPGCFNNATVKNSIMTYSEVMHVVDQAIELGLESVKFLGPGELLANPQLFPILDGFKARNIVIGLFTKGAIMGSDNLAQHYHGMDSQEFVDRLTSYDNVTFLVGGRSFDPLIENKYIPTKNPEMRQLFNYHESRNLAIERLCAAGMNSDPDKRRLAIVASPVGPETLGNIFEMFTWSTERNIPLFVTTTMISGKGHNVADRQKEGNFIQDYQDVAVGIYAYLINRGIMSIDRLHHEGVSPYVGIAPCNQITHGLYIHYDGEVWRCPGNDTPEFVVASNVRDHKLVDIWTKSKNYRINMFNNRCVAKDGRSIPGDFYKKVLDRVTA